MGTWVVYVAAVLFGLVLLAVMWLAYLDSKRMTSRELVRGWLDGEVAIGRFVGVFAAAVVLVLVLAYVAIRVTPGL